MTNARQVKQVFQPIRDRYPDELVIDGNFLWVRPVRHLALRIFISRSSHADFCAPSWSMTEKFLVGRSNPYELGICYKYIFPIDSSKNNCWNWSDPSMLADLISMIETDALPFLRSIDTLEAFAPFYRKRFDRFTAAPFEERLIVDVALGDLDAARKALLDLLPKYRENRLLNSAVFQGRRQMILAVAEPLLAGDRATLAGILHGWEADSYCGSKIERYWERTPFPLEAGLV